MGESVIEAAPELWSPDQPRLYKVILQFGDDRVEDLVGFREFVVQRGEALLNGKKIFLRGISCHEESVSGGKTLTEEEIAENIRLAKEMNCNFIRLAHYPHSRKVAELADRMGIMLWAEVPVYWAIAFERLDTFLNAENQLAELIKRDRNRASVVIWSVGNENADSDERLKFMSSLIETAKKLDPTRAISAACLVDKVNLKIEDRLAEYVDIVGINEYYGWYEPEFQDLAQIYENSNVDKPIFIAEFGASAAAGFRGTEDDRFTEDFQRDVYCKQLEIISKIPEIVGISPWILYDFRSPRRLNSHQRHYNIKGH